MREHTELVFAAAVVMSLLLVAAWLFTRDRKVNRAIALGSLIGLVFAILVTQLVLTKWGDDLVSGKEASFLFLGGVLHALAFGWLSLRLRAPALVAVAALSVLLAESSLIVVAAGIWAMIRFGYL